MKLKLWQTTIMLVALFTLSLSARGHESKKPDTEPPPVNTNIIPLANKILAEEAEASARIINDSLRSTSNSVDTLRSTATAGSLVSRWLEKHAEDAHVDAASKTRSNLAAEHPDAHYEDIEMELGGGWCDLCGCWLHHGRDPNGTPQSEIGHPYVCQGGASNLNCWQHYYKYCLTS